MRTTGLCFVAAAVIVPTLAQAAPPQAARAPAAQPHAVQVGIGGSIRSGDPTVYVPIELSPAFRLEPFFAWAETETTTGGATVSAESRSLGAGGFFRLQIVDRIQAYAGGRLGYVELEGGGTDVDGFSVEPTLGAEFFVTSRFSVALEAFLYRQELDGTSGGAASETENTGSDSRILIRIIP